MKKTKLALTCIFVFQLLVTTLHASTFYVSSQADFNNALSDAAANDSILWKAGTYSTVIMNISKSDLVISAETLGSVVFRGGSKVDISGDHIIFSGFQFLDGNIGTSDVVNITGSHILFTQVNISGYRSYKYLRVREASQYVDIAYCNFENRLNLDDQNILSILVHESQPGYHKIRHCSFKNFDGSGNDLGIEPIRIGLSTQAYRISRTLVEYCYFTQCNGDGEIISSKASQNVYRYNTFENNPKAELVLRHGSRAIVYGNFFLHGKGGVRVREGNNHYIYNNYFYELEDRSIYLQNEASDPLQQINIAFNTIISSARVILGGNGDYKPINVTFANNIFAEPDDNMFSDPTGTETWIGNAVDTSTGITSTGLTTKNLQLVENSEGYFGLDESSDAINAARSGYKELPQFDGMDTIDTEVLFDLMGQDRPVTIAFKDLGCSEYPHNVVIQPIATEANTGPSYDSIPVVTVTAIGSSGIDLIDFIQIKPNPVSDQLSITVNSHTLIDFRLSIYNIEGQEVSTVTTKKNFLGEMEFSKDTGDLPAGVYTIRATGGESQEKAVHIQTLKFIKI